LLKTRILLGGGGTEWDERPILERFASWVSPSGTVLYWPVALKGDYAQCLDWVSSVLRPLGVRRIAMWPTLVDRDPAALDGYDALFIGGGNTYRLLYQLRVSGFDSAVKRFVHRGGILYGGSAGAIVIGKDISTCAHMDENVVGLSDTAGLDLLGGDSVWCHYRPSDDVQIREYVERTTSPTIALPETGGVWVPAPVSYRPLGNGASYRFIGKGKQVL
jgi:dipeptidase E